MLFRESLHVHFVNHALVQLSAKRLITFPVKGVIDHDGFGHVRGVVALIALEVVAAERVWKHGRIPVDSSRDCARIWIDEELRRIAPPPVRRIPGTVHAKPVTLSRSDAA